MTVPRAAIAICLATLMSVALLPEAAAHPAPLPRDFEVRLLHDHSDDWGGHALANDGHDLIALDFREAYVGGADAFIFRLLMNGGFAQVGSTATSLREHVAFTGPDGPISFDLTTSDNAVFTSSMGTASAPSQVYKDDGTEDGARFAVEITIPAASLSLAPGAEMSGFSVTGFAGQTEGDHMPGGDAGVLGAEAAYARANYVIAGPVQYATLTASQSDLTLAKGESATIALDIKNLLAEEQAFTLSVVSPAEVDVSFKGERGGTLAADGNASRALQINGTGAEGTVIIQVVTSLGGRMVQEVQLKAAAVEPAEPPAPSTPAAPVVPDEPDEPAEHDHSTHDHGDEHGDDYDTPSVSGVVAIAAIGATVALARRRMA